MASPDTSDYRQNVSVTGGTAASPRLWTTVGYTNPRALSVVGSDVTRVVEWNQDGAALRRFRFLAIDEPRPIFKSGSGLSDRQQRGFLCAQYY